MTPESPIAWHALTSEQVAQRQESDPKSGLSRNVAAERLLASGRNAFPEGKQRSLLAMFLDQFKDLLVIILIAATVVSLAMGEFTDALVILAILIVNAILGVIQERKADHALEALKKMAVPQCEVIRDGAIEKISSEEVVPGDLVVIREGDYIPADLRLTESYNLRIDEASLTGESAPVEKEVVATDETASLADRVCMAYAGTCAVYGRGRGLVVATGMRREIGRIAQMMQQQDRTETPLQRNLAGLGKMLGIGALAICALVFVVGVLEAGPLTKESVVDMFLTAVSLAVAAIPEGLPAIVTIVLAIGVYRMSKQQAIVRKLPAVETLGCATYICTDKTGTLTQNRMTVLATMTPREILFSGPAEDVSTARNMLNISVLCNDSHIDRRGPDVKRYGDPTELAFVDLAEKREIDVAQLRADQPRTHEVPFDSNRKLMSTLHLVGGRRIMLVKGAPGAVLERCTAYELEGKAAPMSGAEKERTLAAVEEMAAKALRVLAFAWKVMDGRDQISQSDEQGLIFAGLMGMMDPAREEVRDALREATDAGIRCAMITGDNATTAKAVAADIGMLQPGDEVITGQELEKLSDEELKLRVRKIRVFARVWPEQKLRIVKALQENGEVVAMTGDGVNDAPALRKADIGVAMGITGTEVAKETSDVVLADDNFATIVHAIREGRVIFDNIRKFIMYLLACNVGEIFAIFIPILMGLSSPLRPVQILLVNLVTDGVVALSLGVDPPEKGIMQRKPRTAGGGIVGRGDVVFILYGAVFITTAVLCSYLMGRRLGGPGEVGLKTGMTMAFVTLCMEEILRAFRFRSLTKNVWQLNPFSNMYLIWACLGSAAIVFITVVFAPLREVFGNTALNGTEWAYALLFALIPFTATEVWTLVRRKVGGEVG